MVTVQHVDNISDIQDTSRLFLSLLIQYIREITGAKTDPVLPFIYDDISASFTLERSGLNAASYHITYLRLAVYYVSC